MGLKNVMDQLYNQDSVNQKHRTPNSPYSIIIYSHGTRPNPLDVHYIAVDYKKLWWLHTTRTRTASVGARPWFYTENRTLGYNIL